MMEDSELGRITKPKSCTINKDIHDPVVAKLQHKIPDLDAKFNTGMVDYAINTS